MIFWAKLTVLLVLVTLQGCATTAKITGLPSDNQESIFKDGRKALISVKDNTVVVAPETDTVTSGQRANFIVAVKNGTSDDILFSTADIAAATDDIESGQPSTLTVYSYEDLVREEKKRQTWAAVGAALEGAADSMNAANAGYSNTYGTYSGSAYSNYGTSAYGYGSYSSTTYNHDAAQAAQNAAQAKSNARFSQLGAEGRANLQNLSSTILKKETIFPDAWHGGIVKIQLPEVADTQQDIRLVVNVSGEEHQFVFSQEKVEGK